MLLRFAVLVCMSLALDVHAHELQEAAAGLDLKIEHLEGSTAVNGMPLTISRAVGPDVPALAEHLIEHWRRSGGNDAVLIDQCCGWRFASRISGVESRVIQWRGLDTDGELIWSSAVLTSATRAAPAAGMPLPRRCKGLTSVNGQVAGRTFFQRSVRCAMRAPEALEQLIQLLTRDGWTVQRQGALVVQASRGRIQAQASASPESGDSTATRTAGSALVLIESEQAH